MMFTVDSKKLARQIESAFATTNNKSSHAIANMICFHYDGSKLNLSSTDFSAMTFNSQEVMGDGEEFTGFIDAKIASSIAKAIKKENTSVSVTPGKASHFGTEYETLSFCHDNRIISPRCEEIEDFPTFPPSQGTAFEMSAGSLLSMLKKAELGLRHRKSAWEVRYRTLGFRYNENDCLEIIGTNLITLSRTRSNVKVGENFKEAMKHNANFKNFMPVSTDIIGLLKKAFRPEENIKFSFMTNQDQEGSGWASIEGENTRVLVSINGNVELMPIDFLFEYKPKHLIKVDTTSLVTALKATQRYIDEDDIESMVAKLTVQEQSLTVSIKSKHGSYNETFPIEWAKGKAQEKMVFTAEPKNLVVTLGSKEAPEKVMLAPPTNETGNAVWLLLEKNWVLVSMAYETQCLGCGHFKLHGAEKLGKCHFCGKYTCLECGVSPKDTSVMVCNECEKEHEVKTVNCPECKREVEGIEGAEAKCSHWICRHEFTI